jgi:thioesterase domain-containing protein/acyl carrier protein
MIACGRSSRVPKNEIEERMVAIWASILNTRVSISDHFFELGGTSIAALTLISKVQQEFGVKLPQSALFNAPTAETLAALVKDASDGATSRATSSGGLNVIRESAGDRAGTVYFVHDADGNTLLYRHLAEGMPRRFRILALPPATDGTVPCRLTRIQEMAVWFADRILDTCDSGAIVLAGLCSGGALAFETAAELESRGYRPGLVALLDAAHPHAVARGRIEWQDRLGRVGDTVRHLRPRDVGRALAGKLSGYAAYEISRRFEDRRLRKDFVRLRAANDGARPYPHEGHSIDLRTVYRFAKQGFDPRPHRVPVILFRATQALAMSRPGFDDRPIRESVNDGYFGWEPIALGGIRAVDVPGRHSTMLQPPQVAAIASPLAEAIDSIRVAIRPKANGEGVAIVIQVRGNVDDALKLLDALNIERSEIDGFQVIVRFASSVILRTTDLRALVEQRGYQSWVTLSDVDGGTLGNVATSTELLDTISSRAPVELVHMLDGGVLTRRGAVRHLVEYLRANALVGLAVSSIEDSAGFRQALAWQRSDSNSVPELPYSVGLLVRRMIGDRVGNNLGQRESRGSTHCGAPILSIMARREVFADPNHRKDILSASFSAAELARRALHAGWRLEVVAASRVMRQPRQPVESGHGR